jgi:hypothetical protein
LPSHCRLSALNKAAAGTWGSGCLDLRREAKWGRAPAEALHDGSGSPGSVGCAGGGAA